MTLEVVWRNPEPQVRARQTVERIRGNEWFAVYVVTDPDGLYRAREFNVISAEVA